MTFTPVCKGENWKIYDFFFLSHVLGLKLSGMLLNGIRDRSELFWSLCRVLGAHITRNMSHNEMSFTPVYKSEKWKICDLVFLSHAFGLKLPGMLSNGVRDGFEMF